MVDSTLSTTVGELSFMTFEAIEDVNAHVRRLAAEQGITASRQFIDDWVDRSSALAGQNGLPADEIQQMLVNLVRRGVVSSRAAFDLHVAYLGRQTRSACRFDPFGDFATAGYLRNFPGYGTGRHLSDHERMACMLFASEAAAHLKHMRRLAYSDVLKTHETLFGNVYPWAGRDRLETAPNLLITKAGLGNIFALPGHERRAMDHALQQGSDVSIMRSRPGEIMGHMAHAHPFLDGNGRTLMIVHNELCRRAGFHIDWMSVDPRQYLWTLTLELQAPGSGALDKLLAAYVIRKPLDLTSSIS